MMQHIFKLIWKKKQRNFLMMLEIFLAFIVLFAVASLSVYNFRNYHNPTGIDIDNVWVAHINYNTDTMPNLESIRQRLRSYPEVASFSFSSSNVPFAFSTSTTGLSYNGVEATGDILTVEPDYPDVLGVKMMAGRWFNWSDTVSKNKPIVITRKLKEQLFGDEDAIGKICGEIVPGQEPTGNRVVGVVDYFKHKSDYQSDDAGMFVPNDLKYNREALLIKLKSEQDAVFEARLAKDLVGIGKDWSVEIQHLDRMKSTQNQVIMIPLLILFIVCAFLVFNVALGLFGVLFQNIAQRRGEIGVRRAMGATKRAILWHMVGETAMIATFGWLLGAFFAVQFPLLRVFDVEKGVYLWAIALATVAVYLLVVLCALYPSRLAANIYPAVALRED
jgi:putative ABC transport system permease protein